MFVIDLYHPEPMRLLNLPLAQSCISAGFPSPADDYREKGLDLNEYLITNPAATFLVRVAGDSMTNAGIHDGDILVVDRSRASQSGQVVIAVLDGEMMVKRLQRRGQSWFLVPENDRYPTVEVGEETACTIWGVVTYVLHAL